MSKEPPHPYVLTTIGMCDNCGERLYRPQPGAGVISRGASGRWTVVFWLCHNCAPVDQCMTDEELAQWVDENYPNDYVEI